MSIPAGIREGNLVKFEGWDLPGNDVAYYPQFDEKVEQLKDIVDKRQLSSFYALNSRGWIKSFPFIQGSDFKKDSGYDVYVKVVYPGWKWYPGEKSPFPLSHSRLLMQVNR